MLTVGGRKIAYARINLSNRYTNTTGNVGENNHVSETKRWLVAQKKVLPAQMLVESFSMHLERALAGYGHGEVNPVIYLRLLQSIGTIEAR